MADNKNQSLLQLCELAALERDPEKLQAILQEIDRVLVAEDRRGQKNALRRMSDILVCCRICNKPVDLTFDTATDEDGQAVHELCYVKRIATSQIPTEENPEPR